MSTLKSDFRITTFTLCVCLLASSAFICGSSVPAFAQDHSMNMDRPADNTAINERDRSPREQTADQAGQHLSDRDIMRRIRKSVVHDQSLSTYAHNIKIIATNGTVVLKGPVRSKREKQNIVRKATRVAGEGNIVDQISIKRAH